MAAPRCTATKPSRSDIVLDNEEQMRITDQIRAQFDSIAPKRPMKPSRSESDSLTENPSGFTSEKAIPELDKFRNLQSQSHALRLGDGDCLVQEDYLETEYYKELDSIEKRHHKTGSGFIQVGNEGGENGVHNQNKPHEFINDVANGRVHHHGGYKGNPATNDWLPKFDDRDLIFRSQKPNRSEGSSL
ncbi:Maternal effect embryo arrest 59, putative isoform 1 [Cucumis melo var. makuwa]|uniref:Uncharacterized protein LOC103495913 isoform X1 n=2 Tax=Cucumis melo TaxID=3656 RepID=A0A1S3C2G8_CUCME|nr:uncharacterized protein LOC103495913 isoform X1 [Cucumis melo]KAA0032503.1 Maternal effect embryo arrest 59, putative isoform 1 [Cucumis melo var. makuwa]